MTESQRIVITGTSRGLGAEFCKQYLEQGHEVLALARQPAASAALRELHGSHGDRLSLLSCDVGDAESIQDSCAAVAERWDGVDLLINNAGVMGARGQNLKNLDLGDLHEVLEINVFGVIRMVRELLGLLKRGQRPRIANITSKMGSIADNESGGHWAYRISKTALNMASVNMAHELDGLGITTLVLHPGWVQTDMGGSAAPLSVEESVKGMIDIIENADASVSGTFRDFKGDEIPW